MGFTALQVLSSSQHPLGFEVRTTRYDMDGDPDVTLEEAFTPSGDYLGLPDDAEYLYKLGIAPEKASPQHCVCSIGFCKDKQQWVGWSHRAMYSFGLGDRVFDPDYGDDDTPFDQHGERTIETLDDAREAAVAFARWVS